MFPRTEPGVAGDLPAVGEARPVADLPAQDLESQGTDSPGNRRLGALLLDRFSHRLLLGLHPSSWRAT